jgi:hypothetical protein
MKSRKVNPQQNLDIIESVPEHEDDEEEKSKDQYRHLESILNVAAPIPHHCDIQIKP